jgi:hypothetical protein
MVTNYYFLEMTNLDMRPSFDYVDSIASCYYTAAWWYAGERYIQHNTAVLKEE